MEILSDKLELIRMSISFFVPELILSVGIAFILVVGLIKKENYALLGIISLGFVAASLWLGIIQKQHHVLPVNLFVGMIRVDGFSIYLKILIDVASVLTILMTWRRKNEQLHLSEYYALILAVVLGSHLLVMSMNLIMVFLSIELISIASYALTGFAFTRAGSEGGLKYFLFGSVASAVMLYGFSLLYGVTGSLDFSSFISSQQLPLNSPLFLMGGLMALVGFFYKIAAVPLHPWSPDVYEAAPMPVVAFFSVVPKLAGIGILSKFILTVNMMSRSPQPWQITICVVAMLSLTIGNFSALWQKNAKRLMAYSSIAHSGFLLVGVATFLSQGIQYMLFYATVYMLMNFLVFIYLQQFESNGITEIAMFKGVGKSQPWPSIFLLVGLVALIGLPPTAGFMGKLFIFSTLWESYQLSGQSIVLWLFIFGLLNTVVSLFYYLRIPYYAFIKSGESNIKTNILTFENLLGFILVISILYLFFNPGLLMGWINKINFAL